MIFDNDTYNRIFSEKDFSGAISFSYPLSKLSWLRVGGPVDILFRPKSIDNLISFLKKAPSYIPVTTIGVCSNLLIRDGGITGVAVKLGSAFAEIEINNDEVKVGAGNLGARVAMHLAKFGFDMSFLRTIPGTIGGAVFMNAGCYGQSFGDYVSAIEGITREGDFIRLYKKDVDFSYRKCQMSVELIVTSVILKPVKLQRELIEEKMEKAISQRQKTQPIEVPSCGSTFKNPDGKPSFMKEKKIKLKAWKLIDEAGLRGKKIGNAQVSEKHPNFLINLGGATASDIEELGEHVRKIVFEKHNITLDWELIRLGNK